MLDNETAEKVNELAMEVLTQKVTDLEIEKIALQGQVDALTQLMNPKVLSAKMDVWRDEFKAHDLDASLLDYIVASATAAAADYLTAWRENLLAKVKGDDLRDLPKRARKYVKAFLQYALETLPLR